MKYLLAILTIVIAVSVATIIAMWPERPPDENEVVLTVNDYKATGLMLDKAEKQRFSHHENWSEFINSVIVERVLIQEAQRLGIDQEPEFREAVRNYFEQSLVKILIDRQSDKIDDSVSEAEIDTYLSSFGTTITFSITQNEGAITSEIDWSRSRIETERFDNLSNTLQPVLAGLKPGEVRTLFDTGNAWFAVRMEKIIPAESAVNVPLPRESIRTIIASHKREQQLNAWMNQLIANADISIKGVEN